MTKIKTAESIILDVYNKEGSVVAKRTLLPAVFSVPVKEGLVHQAVVMQLAHARSGNASTKMRGEVRGGGRKPWRQKGTGRARHGSIRSPLWRGGGVVFGPQPDRNYSQKMNKKAKRKALCMVLSQKAKEGTLHLLEDLLLTEAKTKRACEIFSRLPFIKQKKKRRTSIGIISPSRDKVLSLSLRNLPFVTILPVEGLRIVDLLSCRSIIMPLVSLERIESLFGKEEKKSIKR